MKGLHRLAAVCVAATTLAVSQPASAVLTLGSNGVLTGSGASGSATINFNGIVAGSVMSGLTSQLTLSFTRVGMTNAYDFSWTMLNNSSVTSRITGFGFDTDPNATITNATGLFSVVSTDQNVPGGVGFDVEQCLSTGNCQGGGGAGAGLANGASTPGGFRMTFASAPPNGVFTISDLFVRYQGLPNNGSGVGVVTPVPEPGTWALMLIGFGAMGWSLRRSRRKHEYLVQAA